MKGFKTVGYVAATILGVLTVPQVQELISHYPVMATFINGTIIVALRWVTSSPIFKA